MYKKNHCNRLHLIEFHYSNPLVRIYSDNFLRNIGNNNASIICNGR